MKALLASAIALTLVDASPAADWSRFRGPNGAGVAEDQVLPTSFAREDAAWKADIPDGKSSPIIAGDRLFLTGFDDDRRYVICFDRHSGRELWRRYVLAVRQDKQHKLNDSASPSPVTDGANVYALFAEYGLVSYTIDGERRWQIPLDPVSTVFGMGTSPILVDSKVIVTVDQKEDSFVAAYDSKNGEMRWKTSRPNGLGAYTTPAVLSGSEVLVSGQKELTSYSAQTGEQLWQVTGFAKLAKSSPIIDDGVVYVNVRGMGEFIAPYSKWSTNNDLDGDGKVTVAEAPNENRRKSVAEFDTDGDGVVSPAEYQAPLDVEANAGGVWAIPAGANGKAKQVALWRYEKALPNVPSPLLYRDVLYLVKNGGIVTTLDPKSGAVLKQGRMRDAIENYYASPIAASGFVYAISEGGKVVVIKAGGEWEVLSTSDLGEDVYATPAIADDRMYIRTESALYCFHATPQE